MLVKGVPDDASSKSMWAMAYSSYTYPEYIVNCMGDVIIFPK